MTRIRALPWPSSHAGVLAFVVAVCVALIAMDAYRIWGSRQTKLEEVRSGTANLARSLAQHAQDAIQAADAVLLGVRERAETEGTGAAQLERLHRSMAVQGAALPLVQGLFLFDERGDSIAASKTAAPTGINYGDRTYFQRHRALPDRAPHVSGPFRSKTDGNWIMVLSRRLDRPDGGFAGVVLATMSIRFFKGFYETFDVGSGGVITLAALDGAVMARRAREDLGPGTSLANSELFLRHIPRGDAGSYEVIGGLDGLLRLGSFDRVGRYPLVVIVSRVKREVLADWRAQAWSGFSVASAIALAVGFLGWRVAGQVRKRQRAEARYRLLADHSSDAIVCAGLDGRFLYVSPSFAAVTGWSAEAVLDRDRCEFVHPDDREGLAGVLARLRCGAESAVCSYRHLREDGSEIWVEEHCRTAPCDGGAPMYVGNLRDITERKSLEDRLTAANAELVALSATDGLTGLANRRRFDQALAAEWGRAGRERHPLSLLLLDADCFKAFNDLYGHPAGDEVLKMVASCIRDGLQRPADLAARYGGEEFAVLLPGTGSRGAVLIAEGIRRAVLARRLPHGASVSGIVSVSLGVASAVPHGANSAALLVEHADAALYEAKRRGRNRTEAHLVRPGAPETAEL